MTDFSHHISIGGDANQFEAADPTVLSPLAELVNLEVLVDGQPMSLQTAVGRVEFDLVDPLWGVVAVWDSVRRSHIINWDIMSALVDPAPADDWVRRQLLLEIACGQPLDWDLIGAALEDHPEFAGRSLAREQGGRVRPGDEGGWVAEHGSIHEPIIVGRSRTIPAALALLEESCLAARSELRRQLSACADEMLRDIARVSWWVPRYQLWATGEEVRRNRSWDRVDIRALLDDSDYDITVGAPLPPPDHPCAHDSRFDRWHQETVIGWAMENGVRVGVDADAARIRRMVNRLEGATYNLDS